MTEKFTVKDLIQLGKECEAAVESGNLALDTEVHVSLEVLKDGDESTYGNRVFGGSTVEIGLIRTMRADVYPTIHLMGEPNFDPYGSV